VGLAGGCSRWGCGGSIPIELLDVVYSKKLADASIAHHLGTLNIMGCRRWIPHSQLWHSCWPLGRVET